MQQVFIVNSDELRQIIREEVEQAYNTLFPDKNKTKKEYLTSKEVEEIFGISNSVLIYDRQNKTGIPYTKKRGIILYDIEDIRKYLAQNKIKVV